MYLYNNEEEYSKDINHFNNYEFILNKFNIINGKKDDNNKIALRNKRKVGKNNKKSKNNKLLKYGVLFVFSLFIIRIILSIIREKLSFETFFYILLIILIGYILIRINTRKKINK